MILTKPEYELRRPDQDIRLASFICKKYPLAAEKLRNRAHLYNESVSLVQKYAKQGTALIIAPDDTCGVSTLKRDKSSLKRLYEKEYNDGQKIITYLNKEG